VYLAGPLGFTEAGRRYHESVLRPAVIAAGFDALDPWEVNDEIAAVFALPKGDARRAEQLPEVNRRIGARNAEMIRECAGVLAVLDGSDVDSGTAAEIGYAAALGRPVVGLRTDLRTSGDNEAAIVNLQVEWFIAASGGRLSTDLADAIAALAEAVEGKRGPGPVYDGLPPGT
jgi:nucleoside 2-deoxyribosyltransferase